MKPHAWVPAFARMTEVGMTMAGTTEVLMTVAGMTEAGTAVVLMTVAGMTGGGSFGCHQRRIGDPHASCHASNRG